MKNMIINKIINILNDMDLITLKAVFNALNKMKRENYGYKGKR